MTKKNQTRNKKPKIAIFILNIIVIFLCSNIIYASNSLVSGLNEEEFKTKMDTILKTDEETGLAVSVFKGDKIIYNAYNGFANKEKKIKIDKDTVFEWGSITKLLVWVSAMQLNEAGKLDLNQDIREILPKDFFKKLKYDEPITMIHLMNHTAGWEDFVVGLFTMPEDVSSLEETLRNLEPLQIEKPGTVSSYSNWGTALAALIIEKITGETFHFYVHRNIFRPLEMNSTAIMPDLSDNLWVKERRKEIVAYDFEGKLIELPDTVIPLYPAGQATGTLDDIIVFAKALSDTSEKNKLFKNGSTIKNFLTPTLMHEDYQLPRNLHGIWVNNFKVSTYGHAGGTVKFISNLLFDPSSGYGYVVLTNNKKSYKHMIEIPTLIFGEINSIENIIKKPIEIEEGFYTASRSFRKTSFFKIYRLLSLEKVNKLDKNNYKVTGILSSGTISKNKFGIFESKLKNKLMDLELPLTTSVGQLPDGRNVLHLDYGDSVEISKSNAFIDIAMFSLFIISILYSLIILLKSVYSFVVNIIKRLFKRRGPQYHPLIKRNKFLNVLAALLIVLTSGNISILFIEASSFKNASTLSKYLIINFAMAVIMAMFSVILIRIARNNKNVKNKKLKMSFGSILNTFLMSGLLILFSINIIYWELWSL